MADFEWPDFSTIIDISPLQDILIFGILLIAGILAFKFIPRPFNWLGGLGLIGIGVAILLGYVTI